MEKYLLLIPIMLLGCAHTQVSNKDASEIQLRNKTAESRLQLSEKKQNEKDKALILEKKANLQGKTFFPVQTWDEGTFYLEVLKRYEDNNRSEFIELSQQFMTRFPNSSFADDVLFLQGQMELGSKHYGAALKIFNQVIQDYAGSNRVPSAYYSKALTLRQMNLLEQSKEVHLQIQKLFPGSVEARKSDKDIKLL